MYKAKGLLSIALFVLLVLPAISRADDSRSVNIPAERWYLLKSKGEPSGYVHVRRAQNVGESGTVLFAHELFTITKGKSISRSIDMHCQNDDYYFPVKAIAVIKEQGNSPATLAATVRKKVPYGASKAELLITYSTADKVYNLKKTIPEHSVPGHLLIEIIPLLPFQKGTVFEFNYFDIGKLSAKRRQKVEYKGLEEVQIKDQTRQLHKFLHKGAGVKKTYYWVDDNHQVIRALRDPKEELLLSTEAEVRKLYPRTAP